MTVLIFLFVADSCHTKEPIKKVFADKGYFGKPNREFIALNKIENGIMRKATTGTELTEYEKERNKAISKVRYTVEQCFGLSRLYNKAYRARFPSCLRMRSMLSFARWLLISSVLPIY